jgi:hypothetical protein
MYTNSRLLQAVINGRGNGKFYRLPPDEENPAVKVKLPLQRDLHVHWATGAPYWPILACGTRVRVKTRYLILKNSK